MIAIGLASCSNDDVVMEENDSNMINFSATAYNLTKAADIYCPNNMITSFTVSATNGTSTFFDGDVVTNNGGVWKDAVTRYWPTGGTLDFYAHVNAGSTFTWSPTEAPKFTDFAPVAAVDQQADLLYAVATGQSKAANGADAVALNFRHALSQIVFQAKNTNPNLYVEIYGVSVCQVDGNGTFTFPTESTAPNIPHGATTGNPVQGAWDTNTSTSYDVALAAAQPVVCIKADAGNTSDVVNLTDNTGNADHQTDNAFGSAMLLLPQTQEACAITTAGRPETGVYFVVKCKIWNVASPNADGTKADDDILLYPEVPAGTDASTVEAADVLIPVSINWQQGMKYIYTFVFGDGNGGWTPDPDPKPVLVPIKFDVTLDEFVPVANPDIPMKTSAYKRR